VKYAQTAPPDLYFKYPENAHNYYLQMAAETGVVGLALFVGFLIYLLWKYWISSDAVKLSCGISLVGLMVFSVAQHPLLVDRFFFVFAMVCAVLAGSERDDEVST
jgi:O-antigen ligase